MCIIQKEIYCIKKEAIPGNEDENLQIRMSSWEEMPLRLKQKDSVISQRLREMKKGVLSHVGH